MLECSIQVHVVL